MSSLERLKIFDWIDVLDDGDEQITLVGIRDACREAALVIAELEARLSEAHGAIKEFTHHTRFAADIWKQQSYIQPLFDVAEALDSTAQVRLGEEGE